MQVRKIRSHFGANLRPRRPLSSETEASPGVPAMAAESVASDASGIGSGAGTGTGTTSSSFPGFDFQEEMRKLGVSAKDDQGGDLSPGEPGFKKKGKGKLQTTEGKSCTIIACDAPAAVGSAQCWRHKRALGRVIKFALKGKKSNSPEYQAYIKIFGEGRKQPEDPELASRVISDIANAMPDDEVTRAT